MNGVYMANVMSREVGQAWHLSSVLGTAWFCAGNMWMSLGVEKASLVPRWANLVNLCLCLLCISVTSSAVDFTHEALRLLEEEPETTENVDRLKDDKAHALLWLYICTLEKNLQEVSTAGSLRILCACIHESPFLFCY